jgi:hypothetical protein
MEILREVPGGSLKGCGAAGAAGGLACREAAVWRAKGKR